MRLAYPVGSKVRPLSEGPGTLAGGVWVFVEWGGCGGEVVVSELRSA